MPFTEFPIPSVELSTVAADARTAIDAMQNTNAAVNAAIATDNSLTREVLRYDGFLDVRDYDAVGDGVADDTAEIQAAFDDMAIMDGIGKVVIPAGNYKITSALILKIPGSLLGLKKIEVCGAGPYLTTITQHTAGEHGIKFEIQSTGDPGTGYCEFVTIRGLTFKTAALIGHVNSTGAAIYTHDDRWSSGHFNGGSLLVEDCVFGSSGVGWDTGIYLEKWDTSSIRRCRFLYNYRHLFISRMTKTVSVENCGISQAESVLVDIGESGKALFQNCDFGNAPQFFRVANGGNVSVVSCNFESNRYHTSASKRYNYNTSTYGMNTAIDDTTGWTVGGELITTTTGHGLKPGCFVHFHYATAMPTAAQDAQTGNELYRVMEDGFTGTTFKVAPVYRDGTTTNGGDTITFVGQRTDNKDLYVDGKVRLRPDVGITNVATGDYWIVELVGTTGIKVSETQSGLPITFTHDTTLGSTATQVYPISPLKRTNVAATSQVIGVSCPAFALQQGAYFTATDNGITGGTSSTAPLFSLGTGVWFQNIGSWTVSGFTGTFGGRVLILASGGWAYGNNLPLTYKVAQDSLSMPFTSLSVDYVPENGLPNPSLAKRGSMVAAMRRTGLSTPDRWYMRIEDANGNLVNAPILNTQIRETTQINSGTEASRYQLKPNTRYRVDFAAAAAEIVLEMPNDTNQSTGSIVDEELAVDDEITIHCYNTNTQTVRLRLTGAANTIRYLGTVSTAGSTGGITMVNGDSITLKCTSTADNGSWQVVSATGTPVLF